MDEKAGAPPAAAAAAAAAEFEAEDRHQVSVVEREADFIRFLLGASHGQACLLLKHLTLGQTNAISEIFQNLLYSEEVDEDLIKSLAKQKNIVRKIGDRKATVRRRTAEIKRHPVVVLRILKRVEYLLPV